MHPRSVEYQQASMDTHCHTLKYEVGAATRLLAQMEALEPKRLSDSVRSGLQDAITKCTMPRLLPVIYPSARESEAACKVIFKPRLCDAGMKWKQRGAGIILSLRTLTYTPGRWQHFWSKINRYGFTLAK